MKILLNLNKNQSTWSIGHIIEKEMYECSLRNKLRPRKTEKIRLNLCDILHGFSGWFCFGTYL